MIGDFKPIERVKAVKGLKVGNFELVDKIKDVHELIEYLQNMFKVITCALQKSHFSNFMD